jgi:hypothetical protein
LEGLRPRHRQAAPYRSDVSTGRRHPPEFVTSIFTVDETDTVAPNGKTYSGFFDFKLYLPGDCANSASGYVCTGTPIAEVTGTTFGVRITVD